MFFARQISSNCLFGVLALLNISGTAVISELVSNNLSPVFPDDSKDISLAGKDISISRRRGVGSNHIVTFTDTITINEAFTHKGLTISASSDSFSGRDMVYITDPSGQCSGLLYGSYGLYQRFKLILDYKTGASQYYPGKKLKLCVGSLGGQSIPFIVANNTQMTPGNYNAFTYADFAYIGDAGNPIYEVLNFDLVIPAQASTAYGLFFRIQ